MAGIFRGGILRSRRFEGITTAGIPIDFEKPTSWLRLHNTGTNALRIFTSKKDFDNNVNYITLAAFGGGSESVAEGTFEPPPAPKSSAQPSIAARRLWARAAAGTSDLGVAEGLRA